MSRAPKLKIEEGATDLAALLRQVLQSRLRDQGLTKNELARRVGVSAGALSNLTAGSTDGFLATWSRILEELDRDLLFVDATGSLAPTVLTRPMNPRIVLGSYSHDLTYSMHDAGIQNGVRIWQIDLPTPQLEDLLMGRALFQLDRVLGRTAIAFAPQDRSHDHDLDQQNLDQHRLDQQNRSYMAVEQ